MADVNNYKCPACGGGLTFNSATGKVVCEYCDSVYEIAQIEELYGAGQDTQTGQEMDSGQDADPGAFDGMESTWDTSGLNSNWGEEASNMREYKCPSCGATLICEKETAATSCPYCDNPTVIETQFAGSLHPDYIIPFKIEKKKATAALKEFYKKKPLLPDGFEDDNHLEEVKGVYVPFWFFDGTASGSAVFHATTEHTSGDTRVTKHYECRRAGDISFKMVPVDASKKMADDLMDSIEPFDYSDLKDFSTAYLPGYLADIHDVSAEECFDRANIRCAGTCVEALKSTVTGYSSCRLKSKNITLKQGAVHYGLLPVYILNTKYEDKKFVYAVNGQTGKVVGELPISKKKVVTRFIRRFLTAAIVGGGIAALIIFAL